MSAVGLGLGLPTEGTMDEYEEEEDSPYEEVRASVSNMDDPDMPVLTFRMWFIGIFLTVGSAAINTFFNFRSPQIYVIALPILCVQPAKRPASGFVRSGGTPARETLTLTLTLTLTPTPRPWLPSDCARIPSVDSPPPLCPSAATSSQTSSAAASSPSIQVCDRF